MAHDNEQKMKLLVIYDFLCRMTDENHALNTDEIISELATHNIKVTRKVLATDIALLNEHGYEVLSYKKKYNYYYVVSRHFDTAEISMLADVVKASKLSSGQKSSLIKKLSEMVENVTNDFEKEIKYGYERKERAEQELIVAKSEVDKPFEHQSEMEALQSELAEINAELDLGHTKENIVLEDETGEVPKIEILDESEEEVEIA